MYARSTATAMALVLTLGAAPAAFAAGTASAEAFGRIDTNNDGVIDAGEVRASSETWFLAYDTDGDGTLSEAEMANAQGGGRLVMSDLDADGDGMISRDEFVGGERGYYDEVAPNEDITTRDYTARVEERDEALVPDLDGDGVVSEDEAAADWERSFIALDVDRDDALADDEWTSSAYADADEDQDGRVDRREYMAYGQRGYYDTRVRVGSDDVGTRDYAESVEERDEALVPMSADLDGDGVISRAEAEQDAERRFIAADRDQNSFLSAPEYHGDMSLEDMVGITDGEPLAQDDVYAYREREFEEADLDGDGTVTVWEYRSYRRN